MVRRAKRCPKSLEKPGSWQIGKTFLIREFFVSPDTKHANFNFVSNSRQEEHASEIASIAKQAHETAIKAEEMTQEALEQQIATGNEIRVLQENVMKMGQKLTKVQSLASNTLAESTDAYNQALELYRAAISLEVPEASSILI